jgi:hypothetical protein
LDRLVTSTPDPILKRRGRIAFWVRLGKQIGYGALTVAILGFVVGAATDFPGVVVTICVAGLVTAIVVLPAPIVFGYGIRAAEREERGARGH